MARRQDRKTGDRPDDLKVFKLSRLNVRTAVDARMLVGQCGVASSDSRWPTCAIPLLADTYLRNVLLYSQVPVRACLVVDQNTFVTAMASITQGGLGIFNPEKDSTTGDASKDAATAFNRGLDQLAAKHGTTIDRGTAENDAGASNQGLKMITQETFDEVVRENMEDFEMSLEEALADTIQQFETQGINLSNIIKVSKDDREKLPVPTSLTALKGVANVSDACAELGNFETMCKEADENKLLACTSAYEVVIFNVLEKFYVPEEAIEVSERDAENIKSENVALMKAVLKAFASCFWKGRAGPPILYPVASQLIASVVKKPAFSADLSLLGTCLRCTRIAMTRNESVKGNFFEANKFDAYIKGWFNAGLAAKDVEFLMEVCRFVRILLTDDDRRQGVSPNTFARARVLGERNRPGNKAVLEQVLDVFRLVESNPDQAADVCLTIRVLAVNDPICQDISKIGGTELLVQGISRHLEHARFCQFACVALKMISNNDANKKLLSENGGINAVLMALGTHADVVQVQQQGVAALSSMTLRQPKNCTAIAAMHGVNTVVNAMTRHPNAAEVQRSSCLLIRNLVSRNPELVEGIVQAGAGELIQLARETHAVCDDVAFSALRDLGLGGRYKDERSAKNKPPLNFSQSMVPAEDI